jgi:hypothetical protein
MSSNINMETKNSKTNNDYEHPNRNERIETDSDAAVKYTGLVNDDVVLRENTKYIDDYEHSSRMKPTDGDVNAKYLSLQPDYYDKAEYINVSRTVQGTRLPDIPVGELYDEINGHNERHKIGCRLLSTPKRRLVTSLLIVFCLVIIAGIILGVYFGVKTKCPDQFISLPGADGCYKVLLEAFKWEAAALKCQRFASRAQLAVVTHKDQNDAIVRYLTTLTNDQIVMCEAPSPTWYSFNFYTSGLRVVTNNNRSNSTFVWAPTRSRPYINMTFTSWGDSPTEKQPDDYAGKEDCVQYSSYFSWKWNDFDCNETACAVCQWLP